MWLRAAPAYATHIYTRHMPIVVTTTLGGPDAGDATRRALSQLKRELQELASPVASSDVSKLEIRLFVESKRFKC